MPPGAGTAEAPRGTGAEAARGLPPESAQRALAQLAGLAPSAVLRRRLEGVAPLLAALDPPPGTALDPALCDLPGWAGLLDAVTVQETRLFRAASQILALADRLDSLPTPRLLSAGCATGEEAWTLAVLAAERGLAADVVGIDLCRPALAAAAAGRYGVGPPDALREVPPAYHAFFRTAGAWIEPLAPPPRFRRANLLALPKDLGGFSAILCRNVLIYLLPEAREAVLRGLVAHLLPGGLLLLGPTDAPGRDLPLRPEPGAPGIWRRP